MRSVLTRKGQHMGSKAEDLFDVADGWDPGTEALMAPPVKADDPLRPSPVRGRYPLPNPENGKSRFWQRVTNFVKMTDDTYHLELWKQRNVAKGTALLIADGAEDVEALVRLHVKKDRDRLNRVVEAATDAAEAYAMADEGTALHKSAELADFAGGDLNSVPAHHRPKIEMYLDALAAHGLRIAPTMIERVTASLKYECAGTFDRIVQEAGGQYVMTDLKTGDSLDLSLPSIAAQLDCYRDGVNTHGVFDGQKYDNRIRVRDDYGYVIYLPSTRDEVSVLKVDLTQGAVINEGNLKVRSTRKIKAKHVSETVRPGVTDVSEAYWTERLNAAWSREELVQVAARARSFGQWTQALSDRARRLADELDTARNDD